MEESKEETKIETQAPVVVEPTAESKDIHAEVPTEVEKPAPVEEPKETPAEPVKVDNVDIDKLKQELEEAKKQLAEVTNLNAAISTLKTDVEAKEKAITDYEGVLVTMVEDKIKKIPTEFAELIPSSFGLKEKLDWLNKAEATGLFNKTEAVKDTPAVEIGKPMQVEVPPVDTSKMSVSQMLKMAYKSAINTK